MPQKIERLTMVSGDFVLTGGMDRANYALADYAARQGIGVELVSHRVSPELAERPGVRWRRVRRPGGLHAVGEPLLDRQGRRAIHERAGMGALGVVNGGNCLAPAVNWVHYVHAVYGEPLEPRLRSLKHWAFTRRARRRERSALARASFVIANSDATRAALLELGVEPERVRTVYYGIDPERFGPISETERADARRSLGLGERPAVAFVGALGDRRKGFDTVFGAWQRLGARSSWDADLVVVGTGPELEGWREQARRRGLSERVRFLGFRKDVPHVLAACDALVAPTRYEAFGLGVAEALARGIPALVSRAAGVAELYPEDLHALLVEDADSVDELAQKLDEWRSRSALLADPVRRLSERIRARTWDGMAAEILALCAAR
ncbi:MAG TPA: glycosyltransferase family 4 protein [Polyangiaceae bacterium]